MRRYQDYFSLPKNLVADGAPIRILRGKLLFDVEEEQFLIQLKLQNASGKGILRVGVTLTEINAKGLRYRERVHYVYSGEFASGKCFGAKDPIYLSHKGVRSFTIEKVSVAFEDGSLWEGADAVWTPCEAQAPIKESFDHDAQVAWRAHFGKRAVYLPRESEKLWLCSCSTPNENGDALCCECGAAHDELFSYDMDVLRGEGRVLRVRRYIQKGTKTSLFEANALVTTAPEGVDTYTLAREVADAQMALEAQERRRRRAKRALFGIGLPTIALVIAIAILVPLWLVPYSHYRKGIEASEANDYFTAYEEFRAAEGYSNSYEHLSYIEEEVHRVVIENINMGLYSQAREIMDPFRYAGYDVYYNFPIQYKNQLFAGDGSSFDSAKVLTLFESNFISSYASFPLYFVYVPSVSGYYNFYSSGERDLFCRVYNENRSELDYDDDSGDGFNFSSTQYLQAGEVYYFSVLSNSSSGYYSSYVYLTRSY